ncbi:hypothetical protein MMC12_000592 [Toensbergia leucococca]|nr:hypothetical protein [Toensbergia leucococca]
MGSKFVRPSLAGKRGLEAVEEIESPQTPQATTFQAPKVRAKWAASPVTESPSKDDGFTTVSRSKHPNSNYQPAASGLHSRLGPSPLESRFNNGFNNRSNIQHPQQHSRLGTTPPSAAAAGRSQVYEPNKKQRSNYMKQSCLPVDERDPALMRVEGNKGQKVPKEKFKLGMIIRAVLHEPDFTGGRGTSNITVAGNYTTNTTYGPVHSKCRKMIIVALYEDNYVCLPLYTHNGRGLQSKANPDEFVSIKDHRMKGEFTRLSKHQVAVTEKLHPDIHPFHLKSTAHLTYPVSRQYSLPVIVEGELHNLSTQGLIELFQEFTLKGTKL